MAEEMDSQEDSVFTQLTEAVAANPDDPSLHFNLGLFLWERIASDSKEKAAEHFVIAAKLNPQDANAFRYLGHYYSKVSVDSQRALKCYQRALTLAPQDSESGESMCDLLDKEGKESLEVAVCREAAGKSPRAFWAFRRLGFLQVHQKKWSEAVQNLQQAIRGYPTSADLWEALGLAYQRLSMFTAAIKSYGRAIELEESRVFAMVESGYVFLMLGSHRKGVEQFQQALQISPENVAAHYGLGCGLLELSKECISSGAFRWGASILEEASKVVKTGTFLAKNVSCMWKLHGDIQLTYANCIPWIDEDLVLETEKALNASILSWKNACSSAALSARRSYQHALHLAPWQANIYTDIAITIDVINYFKEEKKHDPIQKQLPEKMILGGLLLESSNNEFWVALGCLSHQVELKQHAFIRSLQLDLSLAVAWAYLGKLYRKQGDKKLAQHAFDRARSIDPSLALPWAGMSADMSIRALKADEAYDCCLRAVQILPLPEFQMGLAKLALLSGQLSSSEVFGPISQALHHAPQYPESHNLLGLVCEARCDYPSAATYYKLARFAVNTSSGDNTSKLLDISVNLARSLCKAGKAYEAVQECEELKKKGLLDREGLHIYALSSWQLGKNDQALSVVRILAASVKSLDPRLASTSISFICRLLYYISGQEAVMTSILKMPKDLFQSSKVSFVVTAIHILDQSNKLEAVVSSSRSSLISHDEITGMHFLIVLSKLMKNGSEDYLGIQSGIDHLRKLLHKYPNSYFLRNVLGYLLISSKEQKDTHLSTRCFSVRSSQSECPKEGLKRAPEILGAATVACYTTNKHSFPTCKDHSTPQHGSLKLLQKWWHQEPWNKNARYLLILNYIQKAREERYPQHIKTGLEKLISVALSDESRPYQKFQLSLCASEISLQSGDHVNCINHAKNASNLSVPDSYLFFAHLLLCRAYAAENNRVALHQEYLKCINLKTDFHIGLICLKYIECQYGLQSQTDGNNNNNIIELRFEECSKDIKFSWNVWTAVWKLVQGLIAVSDRDFVSAEELFARACSLNGSESALFLCHGAICMELARQQCSSDFLLLAVGSLKKARDACHTSLPILQLLLGQAEASLGYKGQWGQYLQFEWSSWPPEMRPGEVFLHMHLLSRQLQDGGYSASRTTTHGKNPLRWILQAIHLNPSCSRYWKALQIS